MKSETHPTYRKNTAITCACGASFPVGSTRDDIHVDVCSACHPFYTGKQKLLDTAGRVDKFKARLEVSKKMQEAIAKKVATKKSKKVEEGVVETEVPVATESTAEVVSVDETEDKTESK